MGKEIVSITFGFEYMNDVIKFVISIFGRAVIGFLFFSDFRPKIFFNEIISVCFPVIFVG
jgi:hypothetical protein